jgi:hypothetical protein
MRAVLCTQQGCPFIPIEVRFLPNGPSIQASAGCFESRVWLSWGNPNRGRDIHTIRGPRISDLLAADGNVPAQKGTGGAMEECVTLQAFNTLMAKHSKRMMKRDMGSPQVSVTWRTPC